MKQHYFTLIGLCLFLIACKKTKESGLNENPLTLYSTKVIDSSKVNQIAVDIEKNSAIQLAEGFTAKIWASDSLVPDPIALQIDDKGVVYVTRTVRQKNSEFDIRGFEHWKIPSIALESPEERRDFLKEVFASSLSSTNTWLPDLNNDGVHDWKDLAVQKEEIHIIEDTDGDGMADKARGYMINMVEEITDIAGGLLVRARDAFLGMAPNIWRLTDTDNDGIWDTKKSISSGYAVHIGFGGHNVSGVVEGPDGKIYWGIGDIGSSIKDLEGNVFKNPHCGVLARSNPDGSDFEIIATGLRNTHEFAFDDYGNIISCDNDGDHAGESERLVHIVQGSDAGWRTHWQFGKYSDPKNNRYNVWMDEKLYQPHHKSQAAYIVPPIKNFHNGPTGFIHNPGTALGQKWLNKFFVVEFVGNPAQSKIWSFGLKPKGASFDLDTEEAIVSGILPTGIQFGPDGALYAADWVNGWNTKDYGRIWKIDVNDQSLASQRKRTQQILMYDFANLPIDSLDIFLGYEDKRIRQKAQFQLVTLGEKGKNVLINAAKDTSARLKRVHAIWGLGQLYRIDSAMAEYIIPYLSDKDDEIVSQAIKMLGDPKKSVATEQIISLLKHPSHRVVFHSIEALGRMKVKEAFGPLIEAVKITGDKDLYIRHALVHSISQLADPTELLALANDENDAARMISVLVLRRMKHKGIASFINDKNEDIVAEVARGINDDGGIKEAMPTLANLLKNTSASNEVIMRRAINAAVRVGDKENLQNLLNYSLATNTPVELRKEALSALSSWHNPSVLDRVDGRYIGPNVRDSSEVRVLVRSNLGKFFELKDGKELAAVAHLMVAQNISESTKDLLVLYGQTKDEDLKSELLKSLKTMKIDNINDLVKAALSSKSSKLRSTAISLIDDTMVNDVQLAEMVELTFKNGSSNEQQQLIRLMTKLDRNTIEPSVKNLIQNFNKGALPHEVELEFFTLIDSVKNDQIKNSIDKSRRSDVIDNYKNALFGGNERRGYGTFFWNSTAMCVRCHKVDGEGSDVGPDLSKIGSKLTREQLLEALVKPDARIAPGYGTAIVTLTDGVSHTGVLISENEKNITLKTSDAEPLVLAVSRVKEKEMLPSSMPDASKKISLGEIRDLVEYLTTLK
jgi:quinoprotein glucose dehydrogenase